MKRNLGVIAVFLALALLMAFTCPSEDSFSAWLTDSKSKDDQGFLDRATNAVLDAQTTLTADYQDHFLWATVEARRGGEQRRFLGLCGFWFDIS